MNAPFFVPISARTLLILFFGFHDTTGEGTS